MAQNTTNVRPVQPVQKNGAKPAAKRGGAAKKIGVAALIIAIVVPLLIALRSLTTTKKGKQVKKKFAKKYAQLSKKVKRFVK